MTTVQKTLSDELEEVAVKQHIAKPHPRFDMNKYFQDEDIKDVAEHELGRVGLVFPCSVAREMPVGDKRREHIKNCGECQRLLKEFDKIAYG